MNLKLKNSARVRLVLAAAALSLFAGAVNPIASREGKLGNFQGHTDIGATPKSGTASYNGSRREYTIIGGGANMWGAQDAFHFVWRRASGDISLAASVSLQGSGGNEHRKAGLMIRQGLGAGDAYADAIIHGDGLTSLQYWENSGAETREVRASANAPQFIRLERHGNTFTLFTADAQQRFTKAGSATVELRDPVYVGLAVCSHDASALQTAIFRHVKFSGKSR